MLFSPSSYRHFKKCPFEVPLLGLRICIKKKKNSLLQALQQSRVDHAQTEAQRQELACEQQRLLTERECAGDFQTPCQGPRANCECLEIRRARSRPPRECHRQARHALARTRHGAKKPRSRGETHTDDGVVNQKSHERYPSMKERDPSNDDFRALKAKTCTHYDLSQVTFFEKLCEFMHNSQTGLADFAIRDHRLTRESRLSESPLNSQKSVEISILPRTNPRHSRHRASCERVRNLCGKTRRHQSRRHSETQSPRPKHIFCV